MFTYLEKILNQRLVINNCHAMLLNTTATFYLQMK